MKKSIIALLTAVLLTILSMACNTQPVEFAPIETIASPQPTQSDLLHSPVPIVDAQTIYDSAIEQLKKYPQEYSSETALRDGLFAVRHGELLSYTIMPNDFIDSKGQITIVAYTVEGDPIFSKLIYENEQYYCVVDTSRDKFRGEGDPYLKLNFSNLKIIDKDGTCYVILTNDPNLSYEAFLEGAQKNGIENYMVVNYDIPSNEFEKSADIDGDGIEDRFEVSDTEAGYETKLSIDLGSGKHLEKTFDVGYRFMLDHFDIDNDGTDEIILQIDTWGNGGAGIYLIFPITIINNEIVMLPMPELYNGLQGYNFKGGFADNYKIKVCCPGNGKTLEFGLPKGDIEKATNELNIYKKNGKVNGDRWYEDTASDPFYKFEKIKLADGRNALKLWQYVYLGSHANQLGDGISTILWEKGKLKLIDQTFVPVDLNGITDGV